MPKHRNGKVHGKQIKKMMKKPILTRELSMSRKSYPSKHKGHHDTDYGNPFFGWNKESWKEESPDKEGWW